MEIQHVQRLQGKAYVADFQLSVDLNLLKPVPGDVLYQAVKQAAGELFYQDDTGRIGLRSEYPFGDVLLKVDNGSFVIVNHLVYSEIMFVAVRFPTMKFSLGTSDPIGDQVSAVFDFALKVWEVLNEKGFAAQEA